MFPPLALKTTGSKELAVHLQEMRRINNSFNIDYQNRDAGKYYDLQKKNRNQEMTEVDSKAQIPKRNMMQMADR